ncbi:hypothetical protein A3Q56_03884 [Intoshia linei]|uniref:Uncharacterized protein n=1 Tax=Intoshia linei TaxID=1819745 RepID=A0A177B280_9BILA|nr:hypothetical protein A3Q56_03884 [Intoshia linei]
MGRFCYEYKSFAQRLIKSNSDNLKYFIGKTFAFSILWSIGSNFKQINVGKEEIEYTFSNFVYQIFEKQATLGVVLPQDVNLYNYFIDKCDGKIKSFDDKVVKSNKILFDAIDEKAKNWKSAYTNFTVNTLELERSVSFMMLAINENVPILLSDMSMSNVVETQHKNIYESLREFIDSHQIYEKGMYKTIKNYRLISSICTDKYTSNNYNNRLQNRFYCISYNEPSSSSIELIFKYNMDIFFQFYSFCNDVANSIFSTITASTDLYNRIKKTFPYNAQKPYHIFNLHDLYKLFYGIRMIVPNCINDRNNWIQLWMHESNRCFRDRIVSKEDVEKYENEMGIVIKKHFLISPEKSKLNNIVCINLLNEHNEIKEIGIKKINYTLSDVFTVNNAITKYLLSNSTVSNVNVYDDFTRNICKILRTIGTGISNLLMVPFHFINLFINRSSKIKIEKLLDLKENLKLVRRIEKEGVFGFSGIQELNPIVFDNVQPSIIAFPTTWLVEAGFSAVVDIFSKKRSKFDVNNRGIIRLRLNKLIEIDYDALCNKHQCQGSH